MKYFLKIISLSALGLTLLTACKKGKEEPDLTVLRSDTVYLGTSKTTDTIDVLANDTYFDLNRFSLDGSELLKLNADSTVAIQTGNGFYGTQKAFYTVTDKNGSKTATIVVVRGNAEQIKTVEVFNSLKENFILSLYAIDHDTTGVYQDGNNNKYIYKLNSVRIWFPKLSEQIPAVSVNGYKTILNDGTVYAIDNENFALFYTIQEGFTAQAKTLDGKRIVPVSGYTITYHGHSLDYIYLPPAE